MSRRASTTRASGGLALAAASLGGVGYFPIAPATAASAVTVGLYALLPASAAVQLAVIGAVIVAGLWSASAAASMARDEDPKFVVIDETAGMLIACFLLPKTVWTLAAAFLIFRALDIGKWFPMKQLERLPGGWGIMADDLAAGLITRAVMACVSWL